MEVMEIVLLVIGAVIFVLSFVLPVKKEESEETKALAREEIKELVSNEMSQIKSQVDDTVDEAITYAMEKTERSLERLSNEKIMAVNEYSDTVLSEINKNHQEVMFLYDMLNDKHINLKNTVSEVDKRVKEAEAVVKEATPVFQSLNAEHVTMKEETVVEPFAKEDEVVIEEPTMEVAPMISNNNDIILAMHKMGKSDVKIAKELGLGVGEVKLVIDLFKGM